MPRKICGPGVVKVDRAKLAALVREYPDATAAELRDRLRVDCARSTICGALKQMNITFKKRSTRRFALHRSHSDRLVLVTDSVTESRDESGEILTRERLRQLLAHSSEAMTGAAALYRTIDATVDRYRFDAAAADDLTIQVIERGDNGG